MASVSPDKVRLRLGLTLTDISDAEVQVFIDEATGFLSNQTGLSLDPNNCTEDQAKAIADCAAIPCRLRMLGLQAVGWTATLGELTFSGPAERDPVIQALRDDVMAWIQKNKQVYIGRV